MVPHRAVLLLSILYLAGCGPEANGPLVPQPQEPARPAVEVGQSVELEAVPYDALAGNRLAFHRASVAGGWGSVHIVDGATRSSTGVAILGPRHIQVSPLGDALAFRALTLSGDVDTAWDVWVTDLTGESPRRVSSASGSTEDPPSWTPDGSAVVFAVVGLPGISIRMGPPGAHPVPVVHTFDASTFTTRPMLVSASASGHLAASRGRVLETLPSTLGVHHTVLEVAEGEPGRVTALAWNGPGTALAFLRSSPGETEVWVFHPSTDEVRLVATVVTSGSGPVDQHPWSICWAADESLLAFTVPTGFESHVLVVPTGGGPVRPITSAPGTHSIGVSCLL